MFSPAASSGTAFSKWHGLGNDYIILNAGELGFGLSPAAAAALCDRRYGIGSDGVLLWGGSEPDGFTLRIYNPDGSQAEMCGNGIRLLARYLYLNGYCTSRRMQVQTDAGLITPEVLDDGRVRVHMGRARLGGSGITGYDGATGQGEAIGVELEAAGRKHAFTFVSMGNPHCVIEEQGDLEAIDLVVQGSAIERHPLFPGRTNVEFIQIQPPSEVAMRVWERGVGETNACGTGACAVAVAAYRTRGLKSPITVHLAGGDLLIEVGEDLDVYMTGPAVHVFSGELSAEFTNQLKEL